jgi:transposase
MVDTLGLLLMVKVVAADVQERDGSKQLLTKLNEERYRVPRLTQIWFAGGFSGPDFLHWVMDICHWIVDVVLRPNASKGFVLLPKRWTVERTYGWLHWCGTGGESFRPIKCRVVVSMLIVNVYLLRQRLSSTLP